MVWYTHINRNTIDSNRKHGRSDPPIRIQEGKYGEPSYGMEVALPSNSRVIYDPSGRILPCGARLVIVSEKRPEIIA